MFGHRHVPSVPRCPSFSWLPGSGHRYAHARRMRERVSTERHGRWMAEPHTEAIASEPASLPAAAVSQDVIDFIRYCYQRRRIGWPELYDEMCGVAARGEFRGMDYDCLANLGVRFSLGDMQRLAALAHQVVTDERRRRVAITVERASVPVGPVDVPSPDLRALPLTR